MAGSREQAARVDARQIPAEGQTGQPPLQAATLPSWVSSWPSLTAWHHSWDGYQVFYFSQKILVRSLSLGYSPATGEERASGAWEGLS